MLLLPVSVRLLALYYPLVPHLSIQLELPVAELEVGSTSLAAVKALAASLADEGTTAASCQLSCDEASEQHTPPSVASMVGHMSSSLPGPHARLSSRAQPEQAEPHCADRVQPGSNGTQLNSGTLCGQHDAATGSVPEPYISRSADGCEVMPAADMADVPGAAGIMPLPQLQSLHQLLTGLAGAADAVSICDDLHSGLFSMVPSHQLLPGALISQDPLDDLTCCNVKDCVNYTSRSAQF